MAELHLLGVRGAEVIKTGFEGVPHHAVALRAPIERGGGGHTAVHPVVGVLDGDALSAVREATVLHAAAVEVLSGPTGEFQMRAVAVEGTEGGRFDHRIDLIFLVDGETAVAAIEHHFDLIGGEGALLVVLLHIESRHVFARLFDEDVGGRFCFGVVGGAAGGVLVDAENVVSVEIYRDFSVVFVAQFNGMRVDFACFLDNKRMVAGGRIELRGLFRRREADGRRFQAAGQANEQEGVGIEQSFVRNHGMCGVNARTQFFMMRSKLRHFARIVPVGGNKKDRNR